MAASHVWRRPPRNSVCHERDCLWEPGCEDYVTRLEIGAFIPAPKQLFSADSDPLIRFRPPRRQSPMLLSASGEPVRRPFPTDPDCGFRKMRHKNAISQTRRINPFVFIAPIQPRDPCPAVFPAQDASQNSGPSPQPIATKQVTSQKELAHTPERCVTRPRSPSASFAFPSSQVYNQGNWCELRAPSYYSPPSYTSIIHE
jgi:hypothetical protein